jgi:hypothetical protein
MTRAQITTSDASRARVRGATTDHAGRAHGCAVVLLLWPRSAIVGASFIIVVMLGGMATHIVKEGGRHITSEVVPLILATIVLVTRRRGYAPHHAADARRIDA